MNNEQEIIVKSISRTGEYLIRGVAGSGKTLTMCEIISNRLKEELSQTKKLSEPYHIGVVFFNRGLKKRIEECLEKSVGVKLDEIYKSRDVWLEVNHINKFCHWNFKPNYIKVDKQNPNDEAERARRYLEMAHRIGVEKKYDALFIDEAQDMCDDHLKMLKCFLKPGGNFVLFYDEAQNLYGRVRPTWKDLDIDVVGRSSIMKKCMRNTNEIMSFGISTILNEDSEMKGFLDFKTLHDTALINKKNDLWIANLSEKSGPYPDVKLFASENEEVEYLDRVITACVKTNKRVMVIFPAYENVFGVDDLQRRLEAKGIALCKPHLQDEKEERIVKADGQITYTTVYQAKGFDEEMVVFAFVDKTKNRPEQKTIDEKALFYVGVTRAKSKLLVTGISGQMKLLDDAKRIANSFNAQS